MSRDIGTCRRCERHPVELSPTGYCDDCIVELADERRDDPSDEMLTRASIPNAAALLRRATKRGFITPVTGYGKIATA